MATERNNPNVRKVIQANEFQLVDDNGAVRGFLIMGIDGQPHLALLDHNGSIRLQASLLGESGQPNLSLWDERGNYRWQAALYPTGQPTLNLLDQNGILRLMASLDPTGMPILNMMNENQELVVTLGVHPDGDGQPDLMLRDDGEEEGYRFV